MKNKNILITGANSGLGLATAKALAKTEATIVMMVRNLQKGQQALEEVKNESGNNNIHLQVMDLASLASIQNAANEILNNYNRIDILINNAGLITLNKKTTIDGFEEQFAVNHLGHFLLSSLLINKMVQTAQQYKEARILFLSSGAHKRTKGIDFNDLNWEKRKYNGITAYADTKLANILTAKALANKYGKSGIFAHAIAPGAVNTNIFKNDSITGFKQFLVTSLFNLFGVNPETGAATTVFLATSSEALKVNGKYWKKSKIKQAKLPNNEKAITDQLWEVSRKLTGLEQSD